MLLLKGRKENVATQTNRSEQAKTSERKVQPIVDDDAGNKHGAPLDTTGELMYLYLCAGIGIAQLYEYDARWNHSTAKHKVSV